MSDTVKGAGRMTDPTKNPYRPDPDTWRPSLRELVWRWRWTLSALVVAVFAASLWRAHTETERLRAERDRWMFAAHIARLQLLTCQSNENALTSPTRTVCFAGPLVVDPGAAVVSNDSGTRVTCITDASPNTNGVSP
jgi:hypothetical protein